jgi:glycosyltransferase involved in cell wall biosynthesis
MNNSVRHILPGFGYFPDDPAGSPMSGIATVVYQLARESARRGMRTSLVSFASPGDRSRFEVEGISVQRVRPRAMLDRPRIDLSYAGPVAWLGMRNAVDIVHVHSNPYLLQGQRARKRILHYHAADFVSIAPYRRAARRANHLLFCSRFLMDRFTSVVGDVGRPMSVVPNGVSCERFDGNEDRGRRLRDRWGVRSDECLVLFAGNIGHDKGPHVLVEAITRAQSMVESPLRLVLVGSSTIWKSAGTKSDMSSYERKLREEADPALVCFAGALAQSDMPAAYAACDLFVLPSLCPEAFGLVLLEAMASGKAVIGSRVGGIPELVREGETGFVVEPNDPRALSAAIAAVASAPALGRGLGQSGRRRAQRYALENVVAAVLGIYDRTTALPRTAGGRAH